MNVGQILETHLGWACAGLGRQINEALTALRDAMAMSDESQGDTLNDVYSGDPMMSAQLSDGEALEMSQTLRNGVPVATPVFDGANDGDIVEMLSKAGIDSSGQVQLHDGRTGEPFDRKVTVGYIYMLKLHHLG